MGSMQGGDGGVLIVNIGVHAMWHRGSGYHIASVLKRMRYACNRVSDSAQAFVKREG